MRALLTAVLFALGCLPELAPPAPIVAIEPTSPGPDDVLVAVIDVPASDPAGIPVTVTTTWTVDGVTVASVDGTRIPADRTEPGQHWMAFAVVSIGEQVSATGSAEAVIGGDDDDSGDDDSGDGGLDVDDDGDGITENQGDCDDGDATVFPGNLEACNGEDDDCVGGPNFSGEGVDADSDGSPACADCDDDDGARFPENSEDCDGTDSDCDEDLVDSFADADADGDPDCNDLDDDGDGDPDATDCAVLDATRFTGAQEACDEADSDCDGSFVDEFTDFDGDLDPNCTDLDADGDGSLLGLDCDDLDADRFPSNLESCDAVDNDCDGDLVSTFADLDADDLPDCTDSDADGDGSPALDDCDDLDPGRFPGNVEGCDGIDNNCDGVIVSASVDTDGDGTSDCADDDDDGDGDPDETDCDSSVLSIFTGAPEVCDSIDSDCNLSLVDGFANLDGDPLPDCVDGDVDGDGTAAAEDCDDLDSGSTVLVDDGDCDGTLTLDDCDDTDPNSTVLVEDGDCDGTLVLDDCDDGDPLSTSIAEDADCDGVVDPPQVRTVEGIDFVLVPAGTFTMGCVVGRDDVAGGCFPNENPAHSVGLTHAMWVMETEVTQGQWAERMGYSPSCFSSCGANCPVEFVNLHEAAAFANSMSEVAGLANCYTCTGVGTGASCLPSSGSPYECPGYRLPTEAEWEYSGRGGEEFPYSGSETVGDVGWYLGNSGNTTHPVAQKLVNGFGVYGMTGNVWEWGGDSYDDSANYPSNPIVDPLEAVAAPTQSVRGGDWYYDAQYLRVSMRPVHDAIDRSCNIGFRLVRSIPTNDSDLDGDPDATDCDDSDPTRYTNAPELCDAVDSDCDTSLADSFANLDGDLDPDCIDTDADGDGVDVIADCDDLDESSLTVADDSDCDGYSVQEAIDFVFLPSGAFTMGCLAGRDNIGGACNTTELPAHSVTLTHGMWVMEAEVTQSQWNSRMGYNPSYFTSCGGNCPVERVTWHEALAFANSLSSSAGLTLCYSCSGSGPTVSCAPAGSSPYDCTGYRLPTEAEWEYASRGEEDFQWAGSATANAVAWSGSNAASTPHQVGQLQPNSFGLYDMSGNIAEWGWDYWDTTSGYGATSATDPWVAVGTNRALRGGSWASPPFATRTASRYIYGNPGSRSQDAGFRVVRVLP